MLAKILSPVWIAGVPRKAGETVELDAGTFASLARKGDAVAAEPAAPSEDAGVKSQDREEPLKGNRKTR